MLVSTHTHLRPSLPPRWVTFLFLVTCLLAQASAQIAVIPGAFCGQNGPLAVPTAADSRSELVSQPERERRYGKLTAHVFAVLDHRLWNNSATDGLRLIGISAGLAAHKDCSENGYSSDLITNVPASKIRIILNDAQHGLPKPIRFYRDLLKIVTLGAIDIDRVELNYAEAKISTADLCQAGSYIPIAGSGKDIVACVTLLRIASPEPDPSSLTPILYRVTVIPGQVKTSESRAPETH